MNKQDIITIIEDFTNSLSESKLRTIKNTIKRHTGQKDFRGVLSHVDCNKTENERETPPLTIEYFVNLYKTTYWHACKNLFEQHKFNFADWQEGRISLSGIAGFPRVILDMEAVTTLAVSIMVSGSDVFINIFIFYSDGRCQTFLSELDIK